MKATKNNARKVATAVRPSVDTLLLATAFAELERERVDVIERKVLAAQIFHGTRMTRDGSGDQFRVRVPKDSWLMDDVSSAKYHATLNGIHLRAGYEKAADGYCPALVAETLKTEAEWALIDAAHPFLGVTNDALLSAGGVEKRQEYLTLLIKMVVNRPGYCSPLKKFEK